MDFERGDVKLKRAIYMYSNLAGAIASIRRAEFIKYINYIASSR
jgi:hypothetical protein